VKSILRTNKDKYLTVSNFRIAGFSEDEKERFDTEIMKSLKTLETNLNELKKSLETRNSDLKCQNKMDFAHKSTAIAYLFRHLKELTEFFKKLQMTRLSQKKKINKMFGLPSDISKKSRAQPKIVPSQNFEMQSADVELIQENHGLMEKFDNDIEEVQQTQNKMIELSNLINTFSHKVLEQDTTTEQILEMAGKSYADLTEGNKSLWNAKKYNEQYGIGWAVFFSALTFILLFIDYIN